MIDSLARFLRDRRGSIAPMLAFTAIPLMGGVGVAVDFSRANAAKTQFQAALDSTALMLSKNAANLSAADLQTQASKYFNALFTNTQAQNVAVTTSYSSTGGSKVVLSGSATLPTNFLGLLGYSQLTITGNATATWGNTRLRVALVLDNTGSMASDDKMTALKTAAHGLLSQLQAAATNPEDVYVSIVPFNKDVNIEAEQLRRLVAALGPVGGRQRHAAPSANTAARNPDVPTTAAPGRRRRTRPGTAA